MLRRLWCARRGLRLHSTICVSLLLGRWAIRSLSGLMCDPRCQRQMLQRPDGYRWLCHPPLYLVEGLSQNPMSLFLRAASSNWTHLESAFLSTGLSGFDDLECLVIFY